MTSFSDNFWGQKNNGFDVLYHNMKYGQDSSKEFSDFLRESCAVEETYVKLQAKLAKFASTCGSKGSFAPFWVLLKALSEKLSNLHQQLLFSWQELIKEVHKYSYDQQRKHREVKDQQASTVDAVQGIQQTIAALQKAKEIYHARCLEFEKLKRENATPKELERAEAKFKKSHDDYRGLVDKYSNVRNEFEVHMTEACKRFQEVEEKHLQQMHDFVDVYAKAWANQHALLCQVHEEFQASSLALTVDRLIETLVQSKTTGTEKPGPIEFVEADLSTLPPPVAATPDLDRKDVVIVAAAKKDLTDAVSQGSSDTSGKHTSGSVIDRALPLARSHGWFLSKRKKEKKKKKSDKPDSKDDADSTEKAVAQVDEEGYIIRSDNAVQNSNDRDSWYSSSDSDSDAEERRNKLKKKKVPTATLR